MMLSFPTVAAHRLLLGSLVDRDHLPPSTRPNKRLLHQAEARHQSRVDGAWMDGRGRDLQVTSCNL